MSEQTEYFILMAILFGGYVCMRIFVVWYAQNLPEAEHEPEDFTGKGLEIGELSDRVHRVRENWHEPRTASQANGFKRGLLVASKREQVVKLAFFQKPPGPPSETQETGDGLHLLLV